MSPQGKVWVTTLPGGDRVRLEVADTGVGIPQEDMPKIFQQFYRVDKARSRAAGGTGLGLSIVRDAVRRHGGRSPWPQNVSRRGVHRAAPGGGRGAPS